ncbi:hypothetical protein GCM10018785_05720 [Streptomyces longispororuber]|uniref:Uncharacterized protein n=1 Tax=Streptomyces longispororuber TaxID=68230 RepID=A0A919DDM6_9ACTN|nr:hypothetical protein [Streptomyces longispororuber]GHE39009.1 hypothetical protein GCM10018785_05720 [Streptomyces longispororuber]
MLTVEEVRDLLAPRVVGAWDQGGGFTLEVVDLEVVQRGRQFSVYLEVVAPDGRWLVRCDRGSGESHLFNPCPPETLLAWVATALRIEMFEWWETKGAERRTAKQGVRLDG